MAFQGVLMAIRHHPRRITRRALCVLAGVFVAIAPVVTAASVQSPAAAAATYANGTVADVALQYVGRWGGQACRDSRKPGDRSGQCRSFVNCVVWMVSGGSQNLGGRDYFNSFLAAGGQEVTALNQLQRGDIVQEGQGKHTFIIVKHVDGNTFTVVDSNHRRNERVMTYEREVALGSNKRAFRMGSTQPGIAPAGQTGAAPKPMMGNLDKIEAIEGGAVAHGWAIDGDVTRPVDVKLYEVQDVANPSGGASTTVKADGVRMDVFRAHPNHGSSHGFRAELALGEGDHIICAYAVNASGVPESDFKLGCRAVNVR